ncbi:MAG: transcription termination/antitermination protein NusG [Ruminococcus sp.]|nr:transcription termination/antitermination protein NusG [Ruminococcus sp.]
MNGEAKWYVIHTYSGYENNVKQNIEKVVENRRISDLIQEIRIPMETYTEVKDAKTVESERKLFPSYVMIKMVLTDDTWYIVRNTRGVTGFVGTPTEPVPLSEDEIEALGVELREPALEVDYSLGDEVEVIAGPCEGFTGKVSDINLEDQTVEVIISMLGRDTPVRMPLSQVVKCDD